MGMTEFLTEDMKFTNQGFQKQIAFVLPLD